MPPALFAQGIITSGGGGHSSQGVNLEAEQYLETEPTSILALSTLLGRAFPLLRLTRACALLLVALVLCCGLCCTGHLELRIPAGLELMQLSYLTLLNAGVTSVLYFIFVQQMGANHILTFYRIPSE